jgi:hypothetical protein
MLSDLVAAINVSISPAHRALGYLTETLDMRRRARLNSRAWQTHLDHTRSFLLSAAKRCGARERVIVLGSGLLLDVPLAELSSMFGEVLLTDVVCLPEVARQIRSYRNVAFLERDVTGLAGALHRNVQQGARLLPEITPPAGCDTASIVISLNMLSQLWVVPRAYIIRQFRTVPQDVVDDWCCRVIEAHYAWLRSLTSDVCMITDYEAVKRDKEGTVISRTSTIFGTALPNPDASWLWNIAPLGRETPHSSKELIVGAWHFQRHAGGEI